MANLLFEIGTEEMPAMYMPEALNNLRNLAYTRLKEARLDFSELKTMGTPRRLVLLIENLDESQGEAVIETRGPREDRAFDQDGEPTQAAKGFARGQGLKIEDLDIKEVGGVRYVFACRKEKGKPAIEILPDLLKSLILDLPFPRSMRWGYSETRFARPVRWLVALIGDNVIPMQIENVHSSNITSGHRFLCPGPIKINRPEEYLEAMHRAYVVVDQHERWKMILKQVEEVASAGGGKAVIEDELLEQVNYLVEYPTAFLGEFSPDYLTVPDEVLITSMKEHQKYFPVVDDQGKLMPCFIAVRNGTAENIEIVKGGNQRVLKARLEDAYFFYREDTREHLENKVPLLKNVVYQERLGTVWAKTARLQKVAAFIGAQLGYKNKKQIERAAFLCKADLETNMVYEFPELQGVMGCKYALHNEEDYDVARAIYEHYLPRFAGDDIPETTTGIALSLAEKIDNLVGNFGIGVKPSGSQDPFALRRQALGIVSILLGHELSLDLREVIRKSYQTFARVKFDMSEDEITGEVLDFILQRLRGILTENGIAYDVLDAVLANPPGDLLVIREKARALAELKEQAYFPDLMIVFNRPYNLSRKGGGDKVVPNLFQDDAEKELWAGAKRTAKTAKALLEQGDYISYFIALADLRPILDSYFERVMVMVDNLAVRDNRLAQLKSVVEIFQEFADFSKLVA
ncbi:MAG: glycine--tRNA ligase subunit beta [Chitinophagales bacterium]